jgi:hypothetical protein
LNAPRVTFGDKVEINFTQKRRKNAKNNKFLLKKEIATSNQEINHFIFEILSPELWFSA